MTDTTLGAWNARVAEAPVAEVERLIGAGALVVVSPHPDDETIACSGLVLGAVRLGRPVGLVALTDGGHSHPGSREYPPQRLATIRVEEQRQALAQLGCTPAAELRLGLPDGASGRDPAFPAAVELVIELCRRLGATALAAPHPDDPHPDHHAAAALALEVRRALPSLRILFYEVWTRRLPPETPFRDAGLTPFRVATDPALKARALDEHASQLGRVVRDDPQGFVLPPWFLRALDTPMEWVSWLAMPGAVPAPEHFARLYADDGDPWHARSSAYEAEKREAAVRLLGSRRYERALEAGCGEGHLTAALVQTGVARSGLGVDREPAIVERAARRYGETGAAFRVGSLPDDLPDGPFDLVVFSEVLYFLDEDTLGKLARRLPALLTEGADLLLVSYLGPTDTPLPGREAADFLVASLGSRVTCQEIRETPDYRMERLEWRPASGEAPADDAAGRTGASGIA
ncbi:bifunctional PIG-L family deacetylase/class I SAM-dependent methyltransferase [Aureimonas sp. ME7]|uniref:bifunctional PIG-L family deacetylase/class I SAM-dependent methyltransferase n=1 Tax=Aureimonas sp. ME7 TaxID=2744252 RepID=UPI0015F48358|nr:bifunctional PIG-L family deacetylase/class I SAM-dependent methyltransferase [Aureimonas sp. ME7]